MKVTRWTLALLGICQTQVSFRADGARTHGGYMYGFFQAGSTLITKLQTKIVWSTWWGLMNFLRQMQVDTEQRIIWHASWRPCRGKTLKSRSHRIRCECEPWATKAVTLGEPKSQEQMWVGTLNLKGWNWNLVLIANQNSLNYVLGA